MIFPLIRMTAKQTIHFAMNWNPKKNEVTRKTIVPTVIEPKHPWQKGNWTIVLLSEKSSPLSVAPKTASTQC